MHAYTQQLLGSVRVLLIYAVSMPLATSRKGLCTTVSLALCAMNSGRTQCSQHLFLTWCLSRWAQVEMNQRF